MVGCSRPLRARDRWHFGRQRQALAAADGQVVGPCINHILTTTWYTRVSVVFCTRIEGSMRRIETKQLVIRDFDAMDWDVINAILSDPFVTEHMHYAAWDEAQRREWFDW